MNLLQAQVAQEVMDHVDTILEILKQQVSHDPNFDPTIENAEQLRYEVEHLLYE